MKWHLFWRNIFQRLILFIQHKTDKQRYDKHSSVCIQHILIISCHLFDLCSNDRTNKPSYSPSYQDISSDLTKIFSTKEFSHQWRHTRESSTIECSHDTNHQSTCTSGHSHHLLSHRWRISDNRYSTYNIDKITTSSA